MNRGGAALPACEQVATSKCGRSSGKVAWLALSSSEIGPYYARLEGLVLWISRRNRPRNAAQLNHALIGLVQEMPIL